MGKSTYLSNIIMNHVLRNVAYTPPASVYLALFTDMTNVEETGSLANEVSGGGYARKALTLPAASGGEITLDSDLFFDAATADWGTIVGFAIMDASTGGNVLYAGNLSASRAFYAGDTPYIPANTLTVSET
jgi:hypothetical protein